MMELGPVERTGEREVYELRFFTPLWVAAVASAVVALFAVVCGAVSPDRGATIGIIAVSLLIAAFVMATAWSRIKGAEVIRVTVEPHQIDIDYEEGRVHWGGHRYRKRVPLDPGDSIGVRSRSAVGLGGNLDISGTTRDTLHDVTAIPSGNKIVLGIERGDDAVRLATTLHDAVRRLRQQGARPA